MKKAATKQLGWKLMISYLIISLLFVVSVKLHIHSAEHVAEADHGSTVAISGVGSDIAKEQHLTSGEIQVGLDKFSSSIFKNLQVTLFIVVTLILLQVIRHYCVARLDDDSAIIYTLPFAGTPPLRAPPL